MQRLLSFKQSVLPPHHHRNATTALTAPLFHSHCIGFRIMQYSSNSASVTCNVFTDHGEFRSPRVEFRRRNALFNQPLSYRETWQLHSRRRLAPAKCAVKGLILANVVVFIIWRIAEEKFMRQNFMVQLDNLYSGRFHTLITSSFSHESIIHIFLNMLALYLYGKPVEQRFGPVFLLKLYLVGAFVGSVSFLAHRAFVAQSSKVQHPDTVMNQLCEESLCEEDSSQVAALGASDAVLAIMMFDLLLNSADFSLFKFTIPINVISVGMHIWEDIKRVKEDSRIAGVAHLGGIAVGIIAWAWLRKG